MIRIDNQKRKGQLEYSDLCDKPKIALVCVILGVSGPARQRKKMPSSARVFIEVEVSTLNVRPTRVGIQSITEIPSRTDDQGRYTKPE